MFPNAQFAFEEELIVKGHSLDITLTDTQHKPPLKLNIELDGQFIGSEIDCNGYCSLNNIQ